MALRSKKTQLERKKGKKENIPGKEDQTRKGSKYTKKRSAMM